MVDGPILRNNWPSRDGGPTFFLFKQGNLNSTNFNENVVRLLAIKKSPLRQIFFLDTAYKIRQSGVTISGPTNHGAILYHGASHWIHITGRLVLSLPTCKIWIVYSRKYAHHIESEMSWTFTIFQNKIIKKNLLKRFINNKNNISSKEVIFHALATEVNG